MSSILYDSPGPVTRRRTLIGSIIAALIGAGIVVFIVWRLNSRDQFAGERWEPFTDPDVAGDVWTSMLVDGLGSTLKAAGVAALLAIITGFVLSVLRLSRTAVMRVTSTGIIEIFRGLPVVLLMFFGVIALGMPIFWGVVFGLVVYNAAIIAEILRAGIVSLPGGQAEAAYAIGLSRAQTLASVLFPQAIRRMLPSLISQLVVLLKDTSLGFIIGYSELLRRTRLNTEFFGNQHWFQFFVVAAAIYITVNFTLSRIAVWLEKRGTKKAAGGVAKAQAPVGGRVKV